MTWDSEMIRQAHLYSYLQSNSRTLFTGTPDLL